MAYVYVAGPYTQGDPIVNVRNAVEVAAYLMDHGHTPLVPHLNFSWHLVEPRPYEDWMSWCLDWVVKCDALLRIPGDSPGADREVKQAEKAGIPVYAQGIGARLPTPLFVGHDAADALVRDFAPAGYGDPTHDPFARSD